MRTFACRGIAWFCEAFLVCFWQSKAVSCDSLWVCPGVLLSSSFLVCLWLRPAVTCVSFWACPEFLLSSSFLVCRRQRQAVTCGCLAKFDVGWLCLTMCLILRGKDTSSLLGIAWFCVAFLAFLWQSKAVSCDNLLACLAFLHSSSFLVCLWQSRTVTRDSFWARREFPLHSSLLASVRQSNAVTCDSFCVYR